MKKPILCLLAFLSFISVQAQDSSSYTHHRIGIDFGVAIPSGFFAATDKDNIQAAYAKNGYDFNISYEYQFHKYLSATIQGGATGFFIDEDEMEDQIIRANGPQFTKPEAKTTAHAIGSALVGIKGIYGTKVIKVYVNPVFGYSRMRSAELALSKTDINGSSSLLQEAYMSDMTMIYGINYGAWVQLTDFIDLRVNVGHLSSEYDLEPEISTTDNAGNKTDVVDTKFKQPFETVNITAGIGFNF